MTARIICQKRQLSRPAGSWQTVVLGCSCRQTHTAEQN
jgi:hypothetical protein